MHSYLFHFYVECADFPRQRIDARIDMICKDVHVKNRSGFETVLVETTHVPRSLDQRLFVFEYAPCLPSR